jgi:hypothetical protein
VKTIKSNNSHLSEDLIGAINPPIRSSVFMTEIFSLFFIKRVDGCTYTGVRSPRSCDGNVKKLK